MRNGIRTLPRGTLVMLGGTLAAIAIACGGTPPKQEAEAAPPPAPEVLTAAERAVWYQECWTRFDNKSWDAFKGCFADNVESEEIDGGQPVTRGADAVVAHLKSFADAFPDVKGTGELILVNGDTLLSIYLINGTHKGPLAGPGGESIAATNKPIGVWQAHLLQLDAAGNKVVKEAFYMDSGTLMAQLGINPNPARAVATSATATPAVAVAAGTPAELGNVESANAQIAAFNSHDAKTMVGFNAPDARLHEFAAPKDVSIAENLAGTQELFKAFPDAKLTASSVWAAGDYVAVVGRFEGTNTGSYPSMGVKKATGKAVAARFLEVTRWQGGKVKEDWLFYNGMAFAAQLGLAGK